MVEEPRCVPGDLKAQIIRHISVITTTLKKMTLYPHGFPQKVQSIQFIGIADFRAAITPLFFRFLQPEKSQNVAFVVLYLTLPNTQNTADKYTEGFKKMRRLSLLSCLKMPNVCKPITSLFLGVLLPKKNVAFKVLYLLPLSSRKSVNKYTEGSSKRALVKDFCPTLRC